MDFCSLVQTLTQTTNGVKTSVLFQVEGPLQTPLVLLMGLPSDLLTHLLMPAGA